MNKRRYEKKAQGNGWRITTRKKEVIRMRILGVLMMAFSIYIEVNDWFYDELTGIEDRTYLLISIPIALAAIFGKSEWFDEDWDD